jgi:hypothetical protein
MKYVDYQQYAGNNRCQVGGIIESMRLVRKRKDLKNLPLRIMNLNRVTYADTKVGITTEIGAVVSTKEFREWHANHDLCIVQLVYRIKCGYGHYMMLIIEDQTMYLFNSSPKYADAVGLCRTLTKLAPDLGLKYCGTVFKKIGWCFRRQLQVQDTCSVWIAMVYYIIASDPNNAWPNLKYFLGQSLKDQRCALHAFHREKLGAKAFSTPLV